MLAQDSRRRDLFRAEFINRFRTAILEYKRVICAKVKYRNPCPITSESMMIEAGFVGGPAPAGSAADYIDFVAGLLPSN
jgi:hypothetical protein